MLNTQHAFDFNVTHVFTERFSMKASAASTIAASWGSRGPTTCQARRAVPISRQAASRRHFRYQAEREDLPDQSLRAGQPRGGRRHPKGTDRRVSRDRRLPGYQRHQSEGEAGRSIEFNRSGGGWGVTFEASGIPTDSALWPDCLERSATWRDPRES